MIHVKRDKDTICIEGHSGYAEAGSDIVCASVSSIFFTTVGAIFAFDSEAIEYRMEDKEKNKMVIHIKKQDEITNTLLQNMINALYNLVSQYPENIKMESEEES